MMGATSNLILFYLLAALMLCFGVLAVTSRKMLRAATFLLFVLIGTAGVYLMLNYHFLAAVQLSIYAGGILILFVFAILLTNPKGDKVEPYDKKRVMFTLPVVVVGVVVTLFVVLKNKFLYSANSTIIGDQEINMKVIGNALMGTGKYQYLLPFEALSVLLLACIIGGVLIARKKDFE